MIFVNARDSRDALPPGQLADWKNCDSRNGAQERTRTSTTLRPLAPEASASASSATWAQVRQFEQFLIFSRGPCDVNRASLMHSLTQRKSFQPTRAFSQQSVHINRPR